MNMLQQTMLAFTASSLLALSAHADVSGASSNKTYIQVGGTEYSTGTDPKDENNSGHTGQIGSPGIGVNTSKTPFKKVSLNRLEWLARFGLGGQHDISKNLTTIKQDHPFMPTSHKDFGFYAFSKAKTQDKVFSDKVYFGEWSKIDNMTDDSHTVYYVGKDKTNNMPASGNATYHVKGINNVEQNGYLTGDLEANFGTKKIDGTIANNNLSIHINKNTIDPSTASFSGVAIANGSTNGLSKGEFFGDNAYALGGIATFDDKALDTAFAGNQN